MTEIDSGVGFGTGGAVNVDDFDMLVASPEGFATLGGSDSDIWWSPDLVSWSSVVMPRPVTGAELSWTDGTFWLATSRPPSLWRSPDSRIWDTDIDLSYPAWGVPGLEWQEARAGTPVTSGDTTVVPMIFGAQDTLSYLSLPECSRRPGGSSVALYESEPGIYSAYGNGDCDFARIRFEAIDGGLRVSDADDDTVYAKLEGVGMDLIEGWVAQSNGDGFPPLAGIRLAVVDGEALTPVDSPMSPWAPTVFFGGETGFTAYQEDTANRLISVWYSEDGASWVKAEPLGDDADEPSAKAFDVLRAGPDHIEALDADAGRRWTSTDGLTWSADDRIVWRQNDYESAGQNQPWRRIQGPMSREDEDHGRASFARVASGFVRLPADFEPGSQDLKRLLIQVDGQDDSTSVDVTHLGINTADATAPWIMDGTALAAISGNTVVFADASPDWSPTETWIITFEDLPA